MIKYKIGIHILLICLLFRSIRLSSLFKIPESGALTNSLKKNLNERILASTMNKVGFKIKSLNQIKKTILYCIRAEHSNKSLFAANKNTQLKQSNSHKCSPASLFKIIRVHTNSGKFLVKFKNVSSQKFVTVVGRKRHKQIIGLRKQNLGNRQIWEILRGSRSNHHRAVFHFRSLFNHYLMDVDYGRHGIANMITWWNPHKYGNQSFYIEVRKNLQKKKVNVFRRGFKVQEIDQIKPNLLYCFRSKISGLIIAPSKNGKFLALTNSKKCTRYNAFEFIKDLKIKNVFYIGNPHILEYITVNGPTRQVQNVLMKELEKNNEQKWQVLKSQKSNANLSLFHFVNLANTNYLDVYSSKKTLGKMVTLKANNKDNQTFSLEVLEKIEQCNTFCPIEKFFYDFFK